MLPLKSLSLRTVDGGKLVESLFFLIYLVIVYLSPILLILSSFDPASQISSLQFIQLFSVRKFWLLISTVVFAGAVATSASVLGMFAATCLWNLRGRFSSLKWLFAAFIPVPAYIYALSWSPSSLPGQVLLSFTSVLPGGLGNWVSAWWVEVMVFLPITVIAGLLGLFLIDPDYLNAARLMQKGDAVFFRIALPLAGPTVLAGGVIVFLLSLTDYSIPSLFFLSTYSLDIFAGFSVNGDAAAAFLSALPLFIPAIFAVWLLQGRLRRISGISRHFTGLKRSVIETSSYLTFLRKAALALALADILIVLIILLVQSEWSASMVTSIAPAWREIQMTALISCLAAICCLGPAWAAARRLHSSTHPFWWMVLLLPLALPAPLVGIGLIPLAQGSFLLPVLAVLARFCPYAIIVISAFESITGESIFEAARIFQAGQIQGMVQVILPLMIPGLAAAAILQGALSAGEIGAVIMVVPPGDPTLSIRIYNYLHYGASADVAGLCLLIVIISIISGGLLIGIFTRRLRAAGSIYGSDRS